MKDELQHRIYHYEVPPPGGVWEKITEALDDSHIGEKFSKKLQHASDTPPAAAWAAISSTLNELHLSNQYPSTLYNLEASPPPKAWDKIAASLAVKPAIDNTRRAPVIPFLRYAAAAAIIGAVVFGTITLLNRTSGESSNTDIATNNSTVNNQASATQPPETGTLNPEITQPVENSVPVISDEERNDRALEASKQTYAGLGYNPQQRMKKVNEEFFRTPADPIEVSANFNPVHTYEELECTDVNTPSFASGSFSIDMAGRYAMLLSPDGHFIRVSKKLGDLVCCVTGEEQDDACIDQLNKWRRKMANSPVTPAPGNFLDIVDLVRTLKETNL